MEAFIQEKEEWLAALSEANDDLKKDFVGNVASSVGYFIGYLLAAHMERLLLVWVTKIFCPRVKPLIDWLLSLHFLTVLVKASRRLHRDIQLDATMLKIKQQLE